MSLTVRAAIRGDQLRLRAMLEDNDLPVDGVDDMREFVVAEIDGRFAGAGGLEIHGSDVLLRSLVVSPDYRGQGIASAMCDALEANAVASGRRAIYLLTETAEPFFERRGYEVVGRDKAPAGIRQSEEFANLCPASARFMARRL